MFPPKLRARPCQVGSADPPVPPLATAFLRYTAWWVLMSDGRCRGLIGQFGLVCGPPLHVWSSVGYFVQLCCVICLFLPYSWCGCLQSKNHQNSWKWLEISPITTFGVWKLWKAAGIDIFIPDLRTINNTPTLSLCSSSSKEAKTKVDATPLKKPAYKLFQVFSQTCELFLSVYHAYLDNWNLERFLSLPYSDTWVLWIFKM